MMSNVPTQHPEELLPWYVNGTLDTQERNLVKMHIANCDKCKKSIKLLEVIARKERESVDNGPGELAFQQFKKQLKQERTAKVKRVPSWWQPAMAAAILVIIVQSVFLVKPSGIRGIAPFDTVRSVDSRVPVMVSGLNDTPDIDPFNPSWGAVIKVKFLPDATEQEIRSLLFDIDGTFIDGPNSAGVYTIFLDVRSGDVAERKRLLDYLSSRTDVIDIINSENLSP